MTGGEVTQECPSLSLRDKPPQTIPRHSNPCNLQGEFFLTQEDSASRARARHLHHVTLLSSAESAVEKHQPRDERRG
jgi:hypothetical protein